MKQPTTFPVETERGVRPHPWTLRCADHMEALRKRIRDLWTQMKGIVQATAFISIARIKSSTYASIITPISIVYSLKVTGLQDTC